MPKKLLFSSCREMCKDREYGRDGSSSVYGSSRPKSVCIFVVQLSSFYICALMQVEFMVTEIAPTASLSRQDLVLKRESFQFTVFNCFWMNLSAGIRHVIDFTCCFSHIMSRIKFWVFHCQLLPCVTVERSYNNFITTALFACGIHSPPIRFFFL